MTGIAGRTGRYDHPIPDMKKQATFPQEASFKERQNGPKTTSIAMAREKQFGE
jgi:hypothetical protein